MRKIRVLMIAIVSAAAAVSFLANGQTLLMWAFASLSALFLSIWIYRTQRDRNIVAKARLERQAATQASQSMPPMTSKGSRRLFVPPPLNDSYEVKERRCHK